ncbi:stearoyl-CoA desaturase 5-like [Oppia nitens]|uniref:stearoyl-CoA desaturase 5-like n=1 Tax=Oppia nitens TaxID=1686743 RepID=UPI0023DB6E5F|nr:stearoyl-CoA desaturase 5-like [Oppia nitens]
MDTKLDPIVNDGSDHSVKYEYKRQLVWRNIILMFLLHCSAVYGLYLAIYDCQWSTFIWGYFIAIFSGTLGIQCGAHRLWCHRTYKAKLPLQILLVIFNTMALENDIFEWSRDHRLHHKFSDTDADPHNSRRGFFFSHIGWLLCKKHPEVKEKGKTLDMTDLLNNPLIRFQRAFYIPLVIVLWGLIPTYIPYYFWGESLFNAWFTCVILRYTYTLNITWCVNSAAHLWGMKPYDNSIAPVEANMKNYLMGEGFHNYHHVFPWDYSASELGTWDTFNPATTFIDLFAWIGWAYDLKRASKDVVNNRQSKTGNSNFKHTSTSVEYMKGLSILTLPFWTFPLIRYNIWTIIKFVFTSVTQITLDSHQRLYAITSTIQSNMKFL